MPISKLCNDNIHIIVYAEFYPKQPDILQTFCISDSHYLLNLKDNYLCTISEHKYLYNYVP